MTLSIETKTTLAGRRVFVTGHTGFKGSWLTAWLSRAGAVVTGYALAPPSTPNLFHCARLCELLEKHIVADIRDAEALRQALLASKAELVLHLAAQPLVRQSYRDPIETWSTNVMGTVNMLEAVRSAPAVRAVVVVTTDKCYENRNWAWGYRETDELGGHDPYSSSKAATELVVQSYRRSFFSTGGPLLASARAGNVFGGGDWSEDRLIPDAARAVAAGQPLVVRSPDATRPWQHVLDCISGYVTLAAALLDSQSSMATAFNFGPQASDNVAVAAVLARLKENWPELNWIVDPGAAKTFKEAAALHLDSSLAHRHLGWAPRLDLTTALARTAAWYRVVLHDPTSAQDMTMCQLDEYLAQ